MTCDVNQLYKDVAGKCPTSPKVEIVQLAGVDCSVITCVTKTTTYATVAGKCVATWSYTHPTVPIPANPVEVTAAIAPVQLVKNFTTSGVDCSGSAIAVQGVQGQTVQTVPHPTAVQKVQICSAADAELVTRCAPNGDTVIIQYDVTTVPPTLLSAWNTATNAAYVGSLAALTDCGGEKVDISAGEDYCAAGVNYTRVDVISTSTLLPVGAIWLNDAGAPVAAPVAPTKGLCVVIRSPKIYLVENTAILTMAQITAATGAAALETVTVKQVTGTGTATSDSGSGVTLDTKEVWSWDAPKGDTLGASALTFNAGTGKQRVTAIYYT